MTLISTSTTFGLSDLELIDVHKAFGPNLRFTFTWIVDGENGKVWAQSTAGFRYIKEKDGTYKVQPPLAKSNTYQVITATLISLDLIEEIEEELVRGGWQKKVGKNNPVKALLDMEVDLSTKLPKGKRHK
jgi:hypothetical protein